MEDISGKFNDMNRCIEISYKEPGFARVISDGRWVIPFAKNSELEELLVSSEQSIFSSATQTPFGVGVAVEKIFTPPGSSAVKFDSRRNRLEYHKSVAGGDGDDAEVDFLFDSKSRHHELLGKVLRRRRLQRYVGGSVRRQEYWFANSKGLPSSLSHQRILSLEQLEAIEASLPWSDFG